MTVGRGIIRFVWIGTAVLSMIGVVAVVRRALHLFGPARVVPVAPELAALDVGFAMHPWLTLVHIMPGLLFVILGPLQFVRAIRSRWPRVHRWMGRVLVGLGMIIGATALVMSPQMAIGGINETAATMLFAVIFLFALVKGLLAIRAGKVAEHREWMIRAFAVGMAVAAVRPIVGVFFATRKLTHLSPQEFFGTAFWLGFTIQLVLAEVWINYTRGTGLPEKRKRT